MAFPAQFNLSDLNGSNGFVINGIDRYDNSGSVSNAGDVNGDGVDDLIIGAFAADPNGTYNAGESYIVFGGSSVGSSGTIELSSLNGTNGFVINGIDGSDYSGNSVSNAGDVNGDGFDDLIIGAASADPNGTDDAGESYVVFGGSSVGSSGTIELSSLNGTNGFVINGIDLLDLSGISVSNAGDVNGDGVDDLIIGALLVDSFSGESYIVFGGSSVGSSGTIELSTLNGTNGFVINGIDEGDFSASVSNAGDVNGDGVDDLIIGAQGADPNGSLSGESYIVFGGSSVGSSGTIELSTLNGTNGFVINGIDDGDFSGYSVSNAGDVNGDGVDDLIIGAFAADPNGTYNAGESYIVFGGSSVGSSGTIELSTLNGTNGFVINGIDEGDFSGSVSNAGDVNGDGVDDLIIGAPGASPNGNDRAGESYVVFGGSSVGSNGTIELSTLNGTNGFVINGIDPLDSSGFSVSNAGDVNGDGVDDLIIGAGRADPNGTDYAGESYVVFGVRDNVLNEIEGTAARDVLTGDSTDDMITGFQGRDILTGGDGDDQFVYTSIRDAGDIITDFTVGSDTIVLTELLDSLGYTGTDAVGDGFVSFGASGSDAVVQIDRDGTGTDNFARTLVTVRNVTVADISDSSNFVF